MKGWLIIIGLLLTGTVFAAEATAPPAGTPPTQAPTATDPAQIVVDIYNIAILLGGFLAFLMIVYGGIRYALSGANPSGASEGRDAITQALYGLLLLFLSYTILNTINPNLVKNLGFPDFERLEIKPDTNSCTNTRCTPPQVATPNPQTKQCECKTPPPPTPAPVCDNNTNPCPANQLCLCTFPSAGGPRTCSCKPFGT